MLKMCDKYLGEKHVCNLAIIKKQLNDKFVKGGKKGADKFRYYEESALCSVIAHYDMYYKYNNDEKNIFINQYKNILKVYIYELIELDGDKLLANEKRAVDAGGVTREFFTKLFEELFCDEENKKRPFILPEKNSGANRYYINPNFEPDENFRKVLKYINKYELAEGIGNYDTEREYINIYNIIGKFLGVALVNEEIGLPKQFSTYILARFINPKNNIKFNDYYIISKSSESNPDGQLLTKDNYMKYILQLSNHAVTKNFLFDGVEGSEKNMKGRYESLFAGFNGINEELRIFLYNNNVSIDILDKLITNEQLDQTILSDFAREINISVIKYTADDDIFGQQRWVTTLTEPEKKVIIDEMRIYLTNIITNRRDGETDDSHYEFIRKLLQFWTGFSYYDKNAIIKEGGYKFFYMYGGDARRFPIAHTCSYQFEFYGFPNEMTKAEDKEAFLYEKIKYAVFGTGGMEFA